MTLERPCWVRMTRVLASDLIASRTVSRLT
jgi:hypothetical protein